MIDKRQFYAMVSGLKDFYPQSSHILEAIEEAFSDVSPITDSERKALRQYPIQFVYRITEDDGEWTTKLHIWAENCVEEILDLDPIFLGFKNSNGDTVLMSFAVGVTGTHTGHPNYSLLEKMLSKNYSYEEKISDEDGNEKLVSKNAMDETDIYGKTPIDYIRDIAYASGDYDEDEPDMNMQRILETYYKPQSTENNSIDIPDEMKATSSENPSLSEHSEQSPENPI